jgi:hypothetical protein
MSRIFRVLVGVSVAGGAAAVAWVPARLASASVAINPDAGGPGYDKLQQLADWLAQYGLLAALMSVVVGAGGWGLFTAFGGGMHAGRAKICMLGGLGGAFIIGISAILVNGFAAA